MVTPFYPSIANLIVRPVTHVRGAHGYRAAPRERGADFDACVAERDPVLMGFDADTALEPDGDGTWRGTIAGGWDTPRGPLGGYVMAIMLRAFELATNDAQRVPRSATMHFLQAPQPGALTVRAAVERAGRSLSTVSGRMEQGGELVGLALGAYSKAWPGPLLDESPMPEVKPPGERETPQRELRNAPPPPFTERLTMQHRFGAKPFTRAERAEVGGWLGFRERRALDALAVAVLADAWFPAPWPRLAALAPAPTIDLTIHFRAPVPLDDGLLLGRFRSRLVRDGFFDEDGELWSEQGTLVAQSRQLGLLLGAEV
jgi:acyl-CoA thioesterase